jgi:integrase
MAQIFRPVYHVDPATGKRCPAAHAGSVRKKSPTWWIRYYTPDGKRHKVKGYTDKKATENKAAELERRGIRVDAGLVDASDVHAKRPLAEHLADYVRYLTAKGGTAEHVDLTESRVLACLDRCRFVRMSDLQPSAVVGFLAELRKPSKAGDGQERPGRSISTANGYLTSVKGFTRWLWKDRRIGSDPLAGMSKLANGETDVRHGRREYSQDELLWLIETARESARGFRYLTGKDRHALYLTAAGSGLRVSELASLEPASFHLQGPTPFIRLQAAYAKNRKETDQPLPPDVAELLRDFLQSKPADAPVWPGTWHNQQSAQMIRGDLKEARKKWLQSFQDARQRTEAEQSDFLTYCDAEGLFADFHALRHTYISRVVRSGASAKAAQTLARHSTVQLTVGRYAHASLYDLTAAVGALPPLCSDGPKSEPLASTGTDGKADTKKLVQPGKNSLGPFLGPQPAISADFGGQTRTEEPQTANEGNREKTRENTGKTGKAVAEVGVEPTNNHQILSLVALPGLRTRPFKKLRRPDSNRRDTAYETELEPGSSPLRSSLGWI